jgi:hypothetical protein
VVNRYTPKSPPWADGPQGGTPILASELNRIEAGVESLDQGLDVAEARLDAIQAQLGTISGTRFPTGTTAQRPQPVAGQPYLDTTLGKPIIGDGTAWRDFTGTLLTGSGSPTAPTGMTAVTQSDNSIVLTWNPVSGATHYKLYEIASPDGVSGADNLTATTSTRTPSTHRTYEYWVTAFVGGIESAQSNHATAILPFGGGGGGTVGGSPAQVLALGAGGGKWNLGVGYPSGHVDISPSQLEGGWSEAPYFYTTSDGARVHFQVPMNGGRTSSNTKYPRTELREYIGSSKAAWNGASGTHVMSGRTTLIHTESGKPEVVVAQIHDGSDDTLQIRIENTVWRASINGTKHSTSLGTFAWGVEVAWEIRLVNGTLTIRINGSTKITTNPGYGSGQYFKVGMYAQQNATSDGGGNPSNGYASCQLRDLVVSHS